LWFGHNCSEGLITPVGRIHIDLRLTDVGSTPLLLHSDSSGSCETNAGTSKTTCSFFADAKSDTPQMNDDFGALLPTGWDGNWEYDYHF
jgi:hypothetical protein